MARDESSLVTSLGPVGNEDSEDDLDTRIVEELRHDGRITQQELSRRLDTSRPVVSRRLQKILQSRVIRVVGVVHPLVWGLRTMGHVGINVRGDIDSVVRVLAADPRIPFISLTSGLHTLVCEVRTSDLDNLQQCLDRIRGLHGVESTRTNLYTRVLRDVLRPQHHPDVRTDATDRALISGLQRDGRASYQELAELADISPSAARTRVRRLLDTGVVTIGVITRPVSRAPGPTSLGVALSVRGTADRTTQAVAELADVDFMAATLGNHDLICTVKGTDLMATVATVQQIRALPSVTASMTWGHLHILKEEYTYVGSPPGPPEAARSTDTAFRSRDSAPRDLGA